MTDDTNQSYAEQFPWHELRSMLQYKLDDRGIALEPVRKKQEKAPEAGDD